MLSQPLVVVNGLLLVVRQPSYKDSWNMSTNYHQDGGCVACIVIFAKAVPTILADEFGEVQKSPLTAVPQFYAVGF